MSLAPSTSALLECCSCRAFAEAVAARGPYGSVDDLIGAARTVWWHETPVLGWLEAFAAHPRIGDLEGLRKKFGAFADMSKGEQAAAGGAADTTLQSLADWNRKYEDRFGHIFIICAAGKSAKEMLAAVQQRYANPPANELTNAAVEQQKITELRMRKSFGSSEESATHPGDRRAGRLLAQLAPPPAAAGSPAPAPSLRSPITTHVLDTCMGRPAPGVKATLACLAPGSVAAWQPLAAGQTDKDGRIGNLLAPCGIVEPGHYKMTWDTAEYMHRCSQQFPDFFPPGRRFYPSVSVEFEIHAGQEREHFHVPLTWNPFGYSTYRGS